MAATKVFNTSDLVRLIYSFGDPDHRRMTRQLGHDLQSIPGKFMDDFCIRKIQTQEDTYTIQAFVEEMDYARICRYLTGFKRCYCCARHNRGKPILHEGRIVVCQGTVTERMEEEICFCECRHASRRIVPTLLALL